MEEKETMSEKLFALQIAQKMGRFSDSILTSEEKYLSALFDRAERILKWASTD